MRGACTGKAKKEGRCSGAGCGEGGGGGWGKEGKRNGGSSSLLCQPLSTSWPRRLHPPNLADEPARGYNRRPRVQRGCLARLRPPALPPAQHQPPARQPPPTPRTERQQRAAPQSALGEWPESQLDTRPNASPRRGGGRAGWGRGGRTVVGAVEGAEGRREREGRTGQSSPTATEIFAAPGSDECRCHLHRGGSLRVSGGEGGEGGRRGQSGRGGGQGRSADVLTRRWSARVFSTQAWGGEGVGNDSRGWAEREPTLPLLVNPAGCGGHTV